MKYARIGTTVFVVNKASKKAKLPGLKVLPARIIGYQNLGGKIYPILKVGKVELCPEFNIIFTNLEDAIAAIS